MFKSIDPTWILFSSIMDHTLILHGFQMEWIKCRSLIDFKGLPHKSNNWSSLIHLWSSFGPCFVFSWPNLTTLYLVSDLFTPAWPPLICNTPFGQFHSFWANLTLLGPTRLRLTLFDLPVWTHLNPSEPIWTRLTPFDSVWHKFTLYFRQGIIMKKTKNLDSVPAFLGV